MCGIAGIATWRPERDLIQRVERMVASLEHRGPDDVGSWVDDESGIALAHRRLSIIDLSPHGHQPMVTASGRYAIVYNGEIYNFAEMRNELIATGLAPVWRGHSDTEVLLSAIETWGVEAALSKAVGMFALALWDRSRSTLTLARDRVGEKPLYYGATAGNLVFGSELKALCAASSNAFEIDREALSEFMRFGYVPAPRSIYCGVFKVPPGHYVVLGATGVGEPRPYWSVCNADEGDLRARLSGASDDELVNAVHHRLRAAVTGQLVSDVPLGAFLSGGVDSSIVVALMQEHSPKRVRTFTIGFKEGGFDEAPHARAVARHLGTEHTELYVDAQSALDLIGDLPRIYDEPFADSSQIPTALVSKLTRKHVTVSLSGDGGDELFAGYPRYWLTAALWQRVNALPFALRSALSTSLQLLSAQSWDRVFSIVPARRRASVNGRRMHRLAQMMMSRSLAEMYVQLMSRWQAGEGLVLGATSAGATAAWPAATNDIEAMRLWDLKQYLPDDLLVKVDRATMSASLESRAPMLDHRVVELAFALPQRALVRDGVGKWVLRRVLDRYVPRELIDRPKAGFEVPLGDWLRGPLRPWAEALLDPGRLLADGYLDAARVALMWDQHLRGSFDRSLYLWNVLMFQAWLASPSRNPGPARP